MVEHFKLAILEVRWWLATISKYYTEFEIISDEATTFVEGAEWVNWVGVVLGTNDEFAYIANGFIELKVEINGMVPKIDGSNILSWNCETRAVVEGKKENSSIYKGDDRNVVI